MNELKKEKKSGLAGGFLPSLCIIAAGTLWGTMGLFVRRYNAGGLESMSIVAIRAVITTILMLIFLLFYDRHLLKIKPKDLWCFLGTGLLSILFFNFCYFKAITLTSLSVAAILLYTAPSIVAVFSCFLFKEKITFKKIISLLLTFMGCVLVTGILGGNERLTPMGILIGLGAGLGYALYSIFSKYAILKGYHTYTIIFYTFLITAIGIIPFGDWKAILNAVNSDHGLIPFSFLFGLASTVLPYILYTLGLKKTENGRAAILASVEPVVATLLGVLVYGETLGWQAVIGVVLVIGALFLS